MIQSKINTAIKLLQTFKGDVIELSFFELIEKKGFPTRRARFCCEDLKEYKVLDNSIQGIRRLF